MELGSHWPRPVRNAPKMQVDMGAHRADGPVPALLNPKVSV